LDGLLRLDLRILLGCPSLKLPKQDFRLNLAIFRLILIGGLEASTSSRTGASLAIGGKA
jgi:hypothetical protein